MTVTIKEKLLMMFDYDNDSDSYDNIDKDDTIKEDDNSDDSSSNYGEAAMTASQCCVKTSWNAIQEIKHS